MRISDWSSDVCSSDLGESLEDYWEFTHRIFEWSDGGTPNMILDDGGDATLLIHLGMKAEKDLAVVGNPTNEEEEALFAAIKKRVAEKPGWYTQLGKAIRGVTEDRKSTRLNSSH